MGKEETPPHQDPKGELQGGGGGIGEGFIFCLGEERGRKAFSSGEAVEAFSVQRTRPTPCEAFLFGGAFPRLKTFLLSPYFLEASSHCRLNFNSPSFYPIAQSL